MLVCSLFTDSCADPADQATPPLEPWHTAKVEVCTSSRSIKDLIKQPESEIELQKWKQQQRLLQLSGCMIEVLDQDAELDVPSLPNSFQVNTYKVHLRPDGSCVRTPSDSLILSAIDQEAKKIWVKSVKFWNRYGWKETQPVGATPSVLVQLQRKLQRFTDPAFVEVCPRYSSDEMFCCSRDRAMLLCGGRRSFSASHPPRRRFYRATIPNALAPPL